MIIPINEVNLVAVLIVTVAAMAIGSVWYSPLLFMRPWMKYTGIKPNPAQGGMAKGMVMQLVSSLISTFILGMLVYMFAPETIADSMLLGFLMWLGVMVPWELNHYIWEHRPFPLILISTSNSLVTILVSAALLRYFL